MRVKVRSILGAAIFGFVVAALSVLCAGAAFAQAPLGEKPSYTARELSPIPNAQALERSLWLPGLNEGYVPQGIALLDGRLFVSSYRSTDRKQDRGPCRLFALDPDNGATLGHLDLPESCGHAGGLMKGHGGRLVVADTRMLFEIELAPRGEATIGKVVRSISLAGPVLGSFCAGAENGFWLGRYARDESGFLYKFAWQALEKAELSKADAVASIALPAFSQGAAFDAAGDLWIMRSGSSLGELVKLDRTNGKVLARFAMPVGGEGIAFTADGAMWTLSEAGSQRWNHWPAFYPLAFRFDPKRLR